MQKAHKKELAQLKKMEDLLVKIIKMRLLDSTSFGTELDDILGYIAKVYKEAYYGDNLNGL